MGPFRSDRVAASFRSIQFSYKCAEPNPGAVIKSANPRNCRSFGQPGRHFHVHPRPWTRARSPSLRRPQTWAASPGFDLYWHYVPRKLQCSKETENERETVYTGRDDQRRRCRSTISNDRGSGRRSFGRGSSCHGWRPPRARGSRPLALARLRLCRADCLGRVEALPRRGRLLLRGYAIGARPGRHVRALSVPATGHGRFLGRSRANSIRLRADTGAAASLHRPDSLVSPSRCGPGGRDLRRPLSLVCRTRNRLAGAIGGGRAFAQ